MMSTTGNRVCVNSAPRVQIPNSPPRGFSPHVVALSPSILDGGLFLFFGVEVLLLDFSP